MLLRRRLEAVDLGAQLVVFELALAQADAVLGERRSAARPRGRAPPSASDEALALVEKSRFIGAGTSPMARTSSA
jgi:hypothetical protein